jgi:SAM-dependent methyltransferase
VRDPEPLSNGGVASTALLRVTPDDPEYRRQAEAEAEFWRGQHRLGLEAVEKQQVEGPVDRYHNQRFCGDPHIHWYETIAARGRFRRGAILGTSSLVLEARILESNPGLHVTFFDISAGALERRRELLGGRFPGRVSTCVADLNFVQLPAAAYDVIASSSTLHHVTNLEHLAVQLDRALVDGGFFFLEDYVGEPRFQFAAEKKRVYQRIVNRDQARRGAPVTGLIWLDTSDLSPFCGVRSNEILRVLAAHLDEVDVRMASALVTPLLRSRPAQDLPDSPWFSDAWVARAPYWRRWTGYLRRQIVGKSPSQQNLLPAEFLNELFLVGDVLAEAGVLEAGLAFATYRKRKHPRERE